MNYRLTPPPRPRRSPVILLLVLALIPAAALAYTWKWAEAKIPPETIGAASASGSTTGSSPATTVLTPATTAAVPVDGTATSTSSAAVTNSAPAATPVVALATPVMSVRRAPQTILQLISEATLITKLSQLAPFIGETSCLSVSLNGRPIFDHNGDIPVTPASNQKLLIAAVALEALSPEFTFSTSLRGVVADGVVTGDLYFVGGGDPLLSTAAYPATQEYPPTNVTPIESLVANLVAAGVTRVQGNVIADESRYDTERYVPSWGDDVRDIEAGPLSALMLDDAARRVEAGSTARQADPAVGAAGELIELLEGAGINVGGSARAGTTPPEVPELTSVQSAPLSAIVAEMLATSDDNTAELLLKELGVAAQLGNTRAAGLEVVAGTLVTWGIDTTKLALVDGSGLDRGNVVSCNVVRQVLTRQPLDGPLGAGLATAGQTGTLAADTTLGAAMVGRLHAKTGSLDNVKALTGYVSTDGGNIEFSLILNVPGAGDVYSGIWTALGDAFSQYPAGPTIEQIAPR